MENLMHHLKNLIHRMIILTVINVSDWTLPVTECFLFIILKSGLNNLLYLTKFLQGKKKKYKAALLPIALFIEEGGILQQD